MIGIVAALFDEVYEIIPHLQYKKENGYGKYYGEISGKPVSLLLVSPGIKKKSKFIRWIKNHHFDCIILTGFAGALRPGFQLGDIVQPNRIIQNKKNPVHLFSENTTSSLTLYTSSMPILDTEEKEHIHLTFDADIVDMEGYIFYDLIQRSGYSQNIKIIKIIGDRFGDENLMKKEIYFRKFFLQDINFMNNIRNKMNIISETGLFSSIQLYKHKRFLQKQLLHILKEEIFC